MLFLCEGTRLISRAVAFGAQIEELVVAPALLRDDSSRHLVDRLSSDGVDALFVSPEVFETLSNRDLPQGILAVVRQRWWPPRRAQPDGLGWVALDAVQDPGNLGCIMRSADAAGATGILLLGNTADPYDPAAIRASTGAVFSLRLARGTIHDLATWRREGIPVVGTACSGGAGYRDVLYPLPVVLLMGSEQHGLDQRHLGLCDAVVRIPMLGICDSLNLAVATALVLFEALAQQQGQLDSEPGGVCRRGQAMLCSTGSRGDGDRR